MLTLNSWLTRCSDVESNKYTLQVFLLLLYLPFSCSGSGRVTWSNNWVWESCRSSLFHLVLCLSFCMCGSRLLYSLLFYISSFPLRDVGFRAWVFFWEVDEMALPIYTALIAKYYISCFHQADGQELVQRPAQLHCSKHARVPTVSLSAPHPRQQRWISFLIHSHIDWKAPHGSLLHTNSLDFSRFKKKDEWGARSRESP